MLSSQTDAGAIGPDQGEGDVYQHPDTNGRIGTGWESCRARYRLGQADRRQNHRPDCLAAFSYVHDRHTDDRGYAGSVQGTHAEASREHPWRRHPRRAGSGRRMRGRPGRARASLPGDHRYRGVERLRSNRHGFAWPPRHFRDCPRQRDGQGPYSLQNPDAGPSLSCGKSDGVRPLRVLEA